MASILTNINVTKTLASIAKTNTGKKIISSTTNILAKKMEKLANDRDEEITAIANKIEEAVKDKYSKTEVVVKDKYRKEEKAVIKTIDTAGEHIREQREKDRAAKREHIKEETRLYREKKEEIFGANIQWIIYIILTCIGIVLYRFYKSL